MSTEVEPTLARKLVGDLEKLASTAVFTGLGWAGAHPIDGYHLLDGHAWWALLVAAAGVGGRAALHQLRGMLPS